MADYGYIQTTGVIVPDTADLLESVRAEYRSAFGDDLVVDPETPQGMLIAAEVESRDSLARNNAALANQINPNIAGGVFLDALLALMGSERRAASPSVCTGVLLTGVPATLIPAGSRAQTTAGAVFETIADATLSGSGTATVTMQSVDDGPIAASIGTLTQIIDPVLGWETITNPAAAALGALAQSDVSARQSRRDWLAAQGVSVAAAAVSAVMAVPGVTSMAYRENPTGATATIDSVSIAAHSVYTCVDGGANADIAAALLEAKSAGADFVGGVTVSTIEPASGQTYTVRFSRPAEVSVLVRVTAKPGSVTDPAAAIRAAVMRYAVGDQTGEAGLKVGVSVSPYEIAGAVSRDLPGVYIQNVEVAPKSTGIFVGVPIAITIAQVARLLADDVSVVLT